MQGHPLVSSEGRWVPGARALARFFGKMCHLAAPWDVWEAVRKPVEGGAGLDWCEAYGPVACPPGLSSEVGQSGDLGGKSCAPEAILPCAVLVEDQRGDWVSGLPLPPAGETVAFFLPCVPLCL